MTGLVEQEIDDRPQPRFDAHAVWSRLESPVQAEIGAAALLFAYGMLAGDSVEGPEAVGFEAAATHGWEALMRAAATALGGMTAVPALPDLTLFGVRACRRCGCTDAVKCLDGCEWVAPALCSRCAR